VLNANGPADRTIRTFLRAPTGLLVDATDRLRESRLPEPDLLDALVEAIASAAENGHPFTHTSGTGLFKQRHRLPVMFHDMGRNRIEGMVQKLLNDRPPLLVKGMAEGSKELKWLDVPSGPFARGVGRFVHGAHETGE